jgi:Dyp-type peroxidase family
MKEAELIHQRVHTNEGNARPTGTPKRYYSVGEILELPADDEVFEDRGITDIKEQILEDLPVNILQPTRHKYTLYCFITFQESKKNEIVEWLKNMPLTSAWEYQHWAPEDLREQMAKSLYLSFQGYELFCDPEKIIRLIPLNDDDIVAFSEGLAKRCPNAFGGEDGGEVENSYGKKGKAIDQGNYEKPSHALVLIATNDDQVKKWNEEANAAMRNKELMNFFIKHTRSGKHQFEKAFGTVFFEIGMRNPEGSDRRSREWFGFRDGISNPRFFSDADLGKGPEFKPDAPATLNTALRKNRLAPKQYSCGSFVVFLKLEQNVKAFEETVTALAKELGMEDYRGLVSAYLIGRHKDGTPLHKDFNYPHSGKKNLNSFDFENDPNGAVCPFHAHIRKARSRDGREEKRIVRRGTIYGHPESREKGILFLSYQGSLRNFEDIINRGLYGYNYKKENIGRDILFTKANEYQSGIPIWPYLRLKEKIVNFKGGQYFFASAISFIRVNLENCM